MPPHSNSSATAPRGWPRQFVIYQQPNVSFSTVVVTAAMRTIARGRARGLVDAAFYAALSAWGGDELLHGDNWLRRLMGAAGLAHVISKLTGPVTEGS